MVSWLILHKTQQHLKQPGGCCEQSQLDGAPQETSGHGQSEQKELDPPAPALHLISPIEPGLAERTAAFPRPGESRIRRLPSAIRCGSWDAQGSARRALQGFGPSQHTDVQTFN